MSSAHMSARAGTTRVGTTMTPVLGHPTTARKRAWSSASWPAQAASWAHAGSSMARSAHGTFPARKRIRPREAAAAVAVASIGVGSPVTRMSQSRYSTVSNRWASLASGCSNSKSLLLVAVAPGTVPLNAAPTARTVAPSEASTARADAGTPGRATASTVAPRKAPPLWRSVRRSAMAWCTRRASASTTKPTRVRLAALAHAPEASLGEAGARAVST
mmetsp:Transcript_11923/g.38179  ORF Transcript_11923/g.38179 Transcript_11923/m.38179 type:complete len:217 (+) Transcript_11923:880-1530(+)